MVKQHLKHFFFAFMAIVMFSTVIASCGDTDGSEDEETYYGIGSYKYELVLTGDVDKITPTVAFQGINTDNDGATIYDQNGKEYDGYYSVDGEVTAFTSVTASTASNCRVFVSALILKNSNKENGVVTVQYKGYFNNKLVKTGEKTITFTPDYTSSTLSFDVLHGLEQGY